MKLQNYEGKREDLVSAFKRKLEQMPELKEQELKLSWSNWGFGLGTLEDQFECTRLRRIGVARSICWPLAKIAFNRATGARSRR